MRRAVPSLRLLQQACQGMIRAACKPVHRFWGCYCCSDLGGTEQAAHTPTVICALHCIPA
jgi:hypothetical protein